MSAVFGVVRHDGQHVSGRSLDAMREAMDFWGPDGAAIWRERAVGLGHLLRRDTPESDNESMPLHCDVRGLTIVAAARLDNRTELFDALHISDPERPDTPDGLLILECYRKWGRRCVDHLLGDWSFAVWDARDRSLFLARDHFGNTSLYYHAGAGFSAFASSFKGLFALTEVPVKPDRLSIAKVVVSCPLDGASTCYAGIHRLPPAHTAVIKDGQLTVSRYWRMEDTAAVRLGSDQEYVEAFLEVYAEAVRCRTRAHRSVGIFMSGGLDSTSVAALAAPVLARAGEPLRAFSHVPRYDVDDVAGAGRFGDETRLIEATRAHVDNLEVTYLSADEISPVAGVRRGLEVHDEPQFRAGNYFWVAALLQAARQQGVGVMLTGQGGNFTVSWAGDPQNPPLEHLKNGRPLAAWKGVIERRRTRGESLFEAIKSTLVRPLVPVPWLRGYRRLKTRGEPWRSYSALNRRVARDVDLEAELARSGFDPTFVHMETARRTRELPPGLSAGAMWNEAGAAYGMQVRDPTWDKRVIAFCLGTPADQFARHGRTRLLVRRAMQDRLPAEVIWNPLRGLQAADVAKRVREHHQETKTALREIQESDLAREYLNLERMTRLSRLSGRRIDARSTYRVRATLLRGLAAGLFLTRFDRAAGLEHGRTAD